MGEHESAPEWFTRAIESKAEVGEVEVDGSRVSFRAWGPEGAPGVILVHGGAAHARWWDHLGPLLADGDERRVVAMDLSGHGDSGPREEYSLDGWADEVHAVAEAGGMASHPVLVGHSMGGFVTIAAAAHYPEAWTGAMIVDAPVRRPDPETQEINRTRTMRGVTTYPDYETALGRFRLVPEQPRPEPWVWDHIARHSLRETGEGEWTWKFDPMVFMRRQNSATYDLGGCLERTRCEVAVIHAEHSMIVGPDVTAYIAERLGRPAPFVEIPGAHHHLILDQPLAFAAAARALLAVWEMSRQDAPVADFA